MGLPIGTSPGGVAISPSPETSYMVATIVASVGPELFTSRKCRYTHSRQDPRDFVKAFFAPMLTNVTIARTESKFRAGSADISCQRLVFDHHPLGRTRGSGGVDHVSQVVRPRPARWVIPALTLDDAPVRVQTNDVASELRKPPPEAPLG